MSEVIYCGMVSDVMPVVSAFPINGETFTILERLPTDWIDVEYHNPDSGLKFVRFDSNEDFSTWERGRIFNQVAELRWEQVGSSFQCVYLGQTVNIPGLTIDNSFTLTETIQKTGRYYLWGQRMSKEQLQNMHWSEPTATDIFVELQTPRVLRYPVKTKVGGRLSLQMLEYLDPKTGQLLAYRFKGVEAA